MFIPHTHKVNIYRLEETSGKEVYAASPVHTGLDIGIYPAGVDIIAVYPGVPSYQLYDGISEELPTVLNGDKFRSPDTNEEWIVRGVLQRYSLNMLSYQRVVLEKVV